MKIVTISKISIKYAKAKFYILDLALKGSKDPINEFEKRFKKNYYFKDIIDEIRQVKKLKRKTHTTVVKKLGMACSYPGTFKSAIHSILTSKNFKAAILKTIKAGVVTALELILLVHSMQLHKVKLPYQKFG